MATAEVLRSQTVTKLIETILEASEANWDGYGARPVSAGTQLYAWAFLLALPLNVPVPEIQIDPDGEVAFEWFRAPRLVLSVSIGMRGILSYAGLFGRNKVTGAETFTGLMPKALLENLGRLATTRES